VIALVASAVGVKVLTNQLGEAEYGRLALGMTVPQVSSQMLFGPLTTTLSRFASAEREAGTLSELLGTGRQLVVWIGGGIALGALIVSAVVAVAVDSTWAALIAASSLFALLQGVALMLNTLEATLR